ncbi:acyl-CoA dehydrogenase family protein [Corynebacterium bovis]|uniref:Probable acyl-CoA dehydrogenase fadE25 n=2 Tax=Corynebacterium bovis TaxID=36808 RepID=A0A3R8QV11_9CORY|nr:acyl-CoA dehydrogenase family protein [Corynebacterium bovis]MBB3116419.1 alkylation response protein AidB-like acyl-CoA dehydrogenase [Corynebacterium bovis DSM 20582 = CIP 54.80]MDH2455340.1 acyl-CoA dehydrogenase family protein [Corynebacterium bovis]MDK8510648.1 acyl-CoA dehydrogenase family protein [Corynebacterium bovis]MDN8579278.1 acyl-CoA dehydrogenase family protein [Corynebacterium bovis]QQC47503.1 acyl-CoA dehydrogenase family protein [Corynebacterium bovis]
MALNPDFDLFQLPEEYQALRESIRALAEQDIAPHAKDVDANSRFPEEALESLNANGFNAIHVPEEYGGQGGDSVAAAIVIEEVARVCGSSSLIPAVNKLGTMGLILSGSEELKQKVLPDIAGGKMASYALTEREAGSDAGGMKTRARQDGDDWIIDGSKCFITNGGKSTWYTVMAVTDPEAGSHGISAFMVHKDDEGFRVGGLEHKLGIKGSPTAELYFENCRVPGDRMVGEPGTGFKTALATLDHTRPTIGAQALGLAQGAFDAAVAYVKEREQFGRKIADFQNTQFMLADMKMKIDAARLMVYTAAANAERGHAEGGERLGLLAAGSKTFASDTAMSVTTDAVQLFGGYGFTQDFPVERMMRDAKITQIYEGTNQICRMVMGRQILA